MSADITPATLTAVHARRVVCGTRTEYRFDIEATGRCGYVDGLPISEARKHLARLGLSVSTSSAVLAAAKNAAV